jgi:hypothetical protein
MAENKDQQNQGAQQGNINQDRDMGENQSKDIGNKSNLGTTSTNPEKSKLQTVKGSEIADEEDASRYSSSAGDMMDNRSGQGVADNSDVDSGFTRTAAFDGEDANMPNEDARKKGDTSREGGATT